MAAAIAPAAAAESPPIPVLLLKTKSSPTDAYEELFAQSTAAGVGDGDGSSSGFEPIFVPVLEHCFDDAGVERLRDLLARRQICAKGDGHHGSRYGGMIFTSQRAVEAFAKVVAKGGGSGGDGDHSTGGDEASWPYLQDVPIYSVGPATTRALRAVPQQPSLEVSGDHTGNGEDLAYYIREHYAGLHSPCTTSERAAAPLPPLLFVVGEKRRDIIPKVLMGAGGDGQGGAGDVDMDGRPSRIQVDEIVVYGTGVKTSFAEDFRRVLEATQDRPVRWAVVFSPTGCESMLANLGLLDPGTGKARVDYSGKQASMPRTIFVATIGPTTQAYLQEKFGFAADVCADEPSPPGILRGIRDFMAAQARE